MSTAAPKYLEEASKLHPNVIAANTSNYFWGTWPDHNIYQEYYDGSPGIELAGLIGILVT